MPYNRVWSDRTAGAVCITEVLAEANEDFNGRTMMTNRHFPGRERLMSAGLIFDQCRRRRIAGLSACLVRGPELQEFSLSFSGSAML